MFIAGSEIDVRRGATPRMVLYWENPDYSTYFGARFVRKVPRITLWSRISTSGPMCSMRTRAVRDHGRQAFFSVFDGPVLGCIGVCESEGHLGVGVSEDPFGAEWAVKL